MDPETGYYVNPSNGNLIDPDTGYEYSASSLPENIGTGKASVKAGAAADSDNDSENDKPEETEAAE